MRPCCDQVLQDVLPRQHQGERTNGEAGFLPVQRKAAVAVFPTDSRMQPVEGKAMTPIEQQCKEAMERITKYINRAVAQHLYVMRGKVKK